MAGDSTSAGEPPAGAPTTTSPAAIAAQAGRGEQRSASSPLVEPIYQTAVYTFPDVATGVAIQAGELSGYVYGRDGLPNARTLEETLAALEQAGAALACSSGMSALLVTFLTVLKAGDHVVAPRDAYGGTFALLTRDLARFGVEATFVDMTDPGAVRAALRPSTRLLHAEIVANPTMSVGDVAALAEIAREADAVLVVDNTFATPCLCRPLTLGADYVMHSVSKFIGGHNDLIAGLIAGGTAAVHDAREVAVRTGCTLSPFDAWLALRGVKTLPLRMERCSTTALAVARFLAAHPRVSRVYYPGLESHPQYAVARRQFGQLSGAMLSFDVAGGGEGAAAFLRHLRLIPFAPSLGGVGSSVSHPASTSHRRLSAQERQRAGIGDGMIRFSVGLEEPADLIADLEQALGSIS
jgi:cystathionine beta-lyase/cystathionine gamma-synthase